jgi:hypothetical protein
MRLSGPFSFQLLIWPLQKASESIWGGSVKPENAQELMAQKDVDGALVGGICLALRASRDSPVRTKRTANFYHLNILIKLYSKELHLFRRSRPRMGPVLPNGLCDRPQTGDKRVSDNNRMKR